MTAVGRPITTSPTTWKVYVHKISKWQFFRSYQVGSKHSWRSLRKAKKFVEMNSGNTEAFMRTPEVYDCFVEIVGDRNMRQAMVDIVSLDDGSGKWIDENRREYGGYITDNTVISVEPGEISNDEGASIKLREGYSTFHSHPSGKDSDNSYFVQYPSDIDIKNAQGYVSYVFGRSDGIVYIYDGNGVLSKMPYKWFVRFR